LPGFPSSSGDLFVSRRPVAAVFGTSTALANFIKNGKVIWKIAGFVLSDKVLYGIGIPIALSNLVGGYWGSILAIRKGQQFIKVFVLIVFAILFITLV
jgi:uncharacterized membrane protein YfcA